MSEARIYHRSVSQLNSYAGCSEAYRLGRLAKAPRAPAAWTAQGVAFHEATERWELSGRAYGYPQVQDDFTGAYAACIESYKEREPDLSAWLRGRNLKTETDIHRRREKGCEQIRLYVLHALSSPAVVAELPDGSPAVEVPFRLRLPGAPDIIGAIDLILYWPDEDKYTTRDYKTGSHLPGPMQLGIYALAARTSLGMDIWYGDYWRTVKPKDKPLEGRTSGFLDLSRYTPEYVALLINRLDKGIEERVFLPNVGDRCDMCDVRKYCREVGTDWSDYLSGTESCI